MTQTFTTPHSTVTASIKSTRIESIDLLRGVVMIIMALDHVRDYFHADAFLYNPADLSKTTAALFLTRFITHFCAPVFVFLAGTSAFLVGIRKGKGELSSFLLKRGLWLIVLEFTVINFAWLFNVEFPLLLLTVIWALGFGMLALAAFIHLPFKAVAVLGVLFVFGHNLLDGIHVPGDGAASVFWSFLHEQAFYTMGRFGVFVGYPVLPWTGLMMLGYCFGALYKPEVDAAWRKKMLLCLGAGSLVLFVVLRAINVYGDLHAWTTQSSPLFTFLSFINVTKYPPSLDYVLITMGPSFLFLAASENWKGKISQTIISLGRVPMFYYIAHLYLIHIIAVVAALLTGYRFSDMVFSTWVTDSPNLKGYGFGLWVTYVIWIAVVLVLLPACQWYDRYKINNRHKWWLSYL